ncbi:MAG: hypothetical protein JNK29_11405 [Anaerolineales bacterium]|nr:hypothetical protein [Anaerolineales bacterium]
MSAGAGGVRGWACPSCGAPLPLAAGQPQALCLYCGATVVREAGGSAPPQVTVELAPDVLARLRQLLLDERPLEAIRLYQQRAGIDEAQAAQVLAGVIRDLTSRAWRQQPLSQSGFAIVMAVDTACLAAILWGALTGQMWAVGLGLAVTVGFGLALAGALVARIKQLTGRPAPAVVRRLARLGDITLRGQAEPVPVTRLGLEVRPAGGAPFAAECNAILRPSTLARVRPGTVLEVKLTAAGDVIPSMPLNVLSEAQEGVGDGNP